MLFSRFPTPRFWMHYSNFQSQLLYNCLNFTTECYSLVLNIILRRLQLQILAWVLAILIEDFCGFPQPHQANSRILSQTRPWSFYSTSFPITVISLNTIQSELLNTSLYKVFIIRCCIKCSTSLGLLVLSSMLSVSKSENAI